MKLKRILAILLALTMLVGAISALTACGGTTDTDEPNTPGGDEGDNAVDYTVTVLNHKDEAISGLKLKLVYDGGESSVVTTGDDGKATAAIKASGDVKVEFINLVDYGAPTAKKATFASGKTELEIKLNPTITVMVVGENGAPLSGVSVMICHSVCLTPSLTDENGIVTKSFEPKDTIKISIQSVPEGYTFPPVETSIEGTDYHYILANGVYTVAIELPFAEAE